MSASREKKKRQELLKSGALGEPEQTGTPRWKIAVYTLIGVLFVLAFAVVMLLNSNFFPHRATAATVGEHKISPSMYNIYYGSAYQNFYATYADYITLFFDPELPLDEQVYDETTGQTWQDYFQSEAENSLVWAYSLYDLAKEEGLTLSEEDEQTITETMDSFRQAATDYGYSTANGYLTAAFGDGVNEDLYREFLEVQLLASAYSEQKLESFTFTDDEKYAFYAENADLYDLVNVQYVYIDGQPETEEAEDGSTTEATEEQTEAAMQAAKEEAEAIVAGGYDALTEATPNVLDGYTQTSLGYTLLDDAVQWVFEDGRAEGDMEVFESTSGYYVVYFGGRSDNDYLTRNLRVIQIAPEDVEDVTDATGEVDEEATEELEQQAITAAKQDAGDVFDLWQDGEQTEDAFIALAEEHSTDETTAAEGGLLENVYDGQFAEEMNDWIYDEDRQAGDCELFTESDTCYIAYYLGDGENRQLSIVATDIQNDAYNTWYEELSAGYPVELKSFGMHFTVVD